MAFTPVNVLSDALVNQLQKIEPTSTPWGRVYPCRLVLRDQRVIERALLVEEGHWLEGKGVTIADVAHIDATPWRLPPPLASMLSKEGESGMGYAVFTMRLRDGRLIATANGGALFDFPGLPSGVVGSDVVEVHPHAGRSMYGTSDFFDSPPFEVVHFVFPQDI
jgi:hypothetical protein